MLPQAVPPPATPAQQLPPTGPATTQAPATVTERIFASDAGAIFNAIKSDQVKNFELVLGRLKQALAESPDPQRRAQAAGWKIYKAAETGPSGSILYVFVMDPAVKGADYGVAKILAEAFPAEAQELYRIYINTFASGQTMLNLNPIP